MDEGGEVCILTGVDEEGVVIHECGIVCIKTILLRAPRQLRDNRLITQCTNSFNYGYVYCFWMGFQLTMTDFDALIAWLQPAD